MAKHARRAVTAILRDAQDRTGITHEEIAQRVGVKASTVGEWFDTGMKPGIKYLPRLCAALGISPELIRLAASHDHYAEGAVEPVPVDVCDHTFRHDPDAAGWTGCTDCEISFPPPWHARERTGINWVMVRDLCEAVKTSACPPVVAAVSMGISAATFAVWYQNPTVRTLVDQACAFAVMDATKRAHLSDPMGWLTKSPNGRSAGFVERKEVDVQQTTITEGPVTVDYSQLSDDELSQLETLERKALTNGTPENHPRA